VIRSQLDAAKWSLRYGAWCTHLEQRFSIAADKSCKNWGRLYRLPRVVRDGALQVPALVLGDPSAVGFWSVEVDVPSVTERPPVNHVLGPPPDIDTNERNRIMYALAQAWPQGSNGQGDRHNASNALCGALAGGNWHEDAIAEFVADVDRYSGGPLDGNYSKRCDQAARATSRHERGAGNTGWGTLKQWIDSATIDEADRVLTPKPPVSDPMLAMFGVPSTARASTQTFFGAQLAARYAAAPALQIAAPPDLYGPDLLSFLGEDDPGEDEYAWLVRGIVARGVPQFIAGTPKSRKTWIMEHVAICIAAGIPWLDRFPTARGRVLLLPREDSLRETRRRIWRLARGLGLDPRDLSETLRVDSAQPFYFSRAEDVVRMQRTIEAWHPDLIMIDSLSRTHMGDESSVKEMQIVTSTWGDLCQRYGVAITIIHHLTKSGEGSLLQRLRGTGDLGALARHLIGVEKKSESTSALSFEGNLAGAPEPFFVEFVDETTPQGKASVRLAYVDSEQSTESARIDAEILATVARCSPSGCSGNEIEKEVTGKNDRIRARLRALVDKGRLRRFNQRYHLGLEPSVGGAS